MNSHGQHRAFPLILSGIFRIILIAVGFSTAKALIFVVESRDRFFESFPGASETVYVLFLIGAVVGVVSLVGLFHFQRWAFRIFVVLALVINVLNFLIAAPTLHTLSAVILTGIILGLIYLLRDRFPGLTRS